MLQTAVAKYIEVTKCGQVQVKSENINLYSLTKKCWSVEINVLSWLHPAGIVCPFDISGQRGVCSFQSCINTSVDVYIITFPVFNSFVRIQRNHKKAEEVNLTNNCYRKRTVQWNTRSFTLQPFWPEIVVSAQACADTNWVFFPSRSISGRVLF